MTWKWKRIESAQKYSYVIKIMQLTAVIVALGFLLFKTCLCHAHVDLHFHSIEWEAEQKMREERETLVEEWHQQHPDSSGEGDERIRQGLDCPC